MRAVGGQLCLTCPSSRLPTCCVWVSRVPSARSCCPVNPPHRHASHRLNPHSYVPFGGPSFCTEPPGERPLVCPASRLPKISVSVRQG